MNKCDFYVAMIGYPLPPRKIATFSDAILSENYNVHRNAARPDQYATLAGVMDFLVIIL